jgi:hypothetical protein
MRLPINFQALIDLYIVNIPIAIDKEKKILKILEIYKQKE